MRDNVFDIGVELNKIEQMDCYEYLDKIKDKSIDTVISDVPYNLSGDDETKVIL